jgi:hypothetical protein
MFACEGGHTEAISLLLTSGAGINLQDYVAPHPPSPPSLTLLTLERLDCALLRL